MICHCKGFIHMDPLWLCASMHCLKYYPAIQTIRVSTAHASASCPWWQPQCSCFSYFILVSANVCKQVRDTVIFSWSYIWLAQIIRGIVCGTPSVHKTATGGQGSEQSSKPACFWCIHKRPVYCDIYESLSLSIAVTSPCPSQARKRAQNSQTWIETSARIKWCTREERRSYQERIHKAKCAPPAQVHDILYRNFNSGLVGKVNCGHSSCQWASQEIQKIDASIRSQLWKLEVDALAYRVQTASLQRLCRSYTHDALRVCDRLTKSCQYT